MLACRLALIALGLGAGEGPGRDAAAVRPVAVLRSSGPAYPSPDGSRYAAGAAIDGNPATFCCLLDDTTGGSDQQTIPAGAVEPVTGQLVFDLGSPLARSASGSSPEPMADRSIRSWSTSSISPRASRRATLHPVSRNPRRAPQPLKAGYTFPPLCNGAADVVEWPAVEARYLGLQVRSSYESGGRDFNFQIGELEFLVEPDPRAGLRHLLRQVDQLQASVAHLAALFPDRYPAAAQQERLAGLPAAFGRGERRPDAPGRTHLPPVADGIRFAETGTARRPQSALGVRQDPVRQAPHLPDRLVLLRVHAGRPVRRQPVRARSGRRIGARTAARPAGGIFDRYDLAFDGQRVVFGYQAGTGTGLSLVRSGNRRRRAAATHHGPARGARVARLARAGSHPERTRPLAGTTPTISIPATCPTAASVLPRRAASGACSAIRAISLAVNVLYRIDADGQSLRLLVRGGAERVDAERDERRPHPLHPLGIRRQRRDRRAGPVGDAARRHRHLRGLRQPASSSRRC